MKKSNFLLIKCEGCGKPFPANPVCKSIKKNRPRYCNYCKECLTFKKGIELLLEQLYKRQIEIKDEIDRIKEFHEKRMKELLGD